jgi:hypothetical protein
MPWVYPHMPEAAIKNRNGKLIKLQIHVDALRA